MIEPDTKDWTWVLDRPCPECGYDAATVDRGRLGAAIRGDASGWTAMLASSGARDRPSPEVWSPVEYACHVRDVHAVMGRRLAVMLSEDDPTFDNWDQDATAVQDRYDAQEPSVVSAQLSVAADTMAAQYDALAQVEAATWDRRGRRSNGSVFTVDTLGRYHLHDLVHHAHDVRAQAARATAAAYDVDAAGFADATADVSDQMQPRLERFAAAVGPRGEVLEIGSGGGRDAAALAELGLVVHCTDVSAGFVALLRSRGLRARVCDPLRDELGGPYDGVWASASLLHVARPDLPAVLDHLATATRPGGVLGLSLKEGDGEAWSTHGTITAPRRFVFWREAPLRAVLTGAGWDVEELVVEVSRLNQQPWLLGLARRR